MFRADLDRERGDSAYARDTIISSPRLRG